MNTRKTFNGIKPRRRISLPMSFLMAIVLFLAAVAIAAWIGVAGLYLSDSGGRYAVKGNDFKVSHSYGDTVKPSDLHQGQIDDGGYK